jgi:magnesium transporter
MTQTNNEINDVLSKMTALGSVLIPMNLVTGLFGMNVPVPGQFTEGTEVRKRKKLIYTTI